MWKSFTWYDVRVIGHYLGTLVLVSSLALAVPLVTAVLFAEWEPASHYLVTIGIAMVVGSLLRFLRIEPGRLNRQQALAVTGLAWIVLAFIASIPLYLSGHYLNYLDALFDGVSGITTTGASVIVDLNHLSYADNMWRFVMHLIGGLGLIVVALTFGLFGKQSGASLYASEGRSEHVVPSVVQTTRFIARVAAICILFATAVLFGLCLILGMETPRALLHAFWLAVSGFMTGGFTPMATSVGYYHFALIEFVLMILMLLGSVNFVLYETLRHGRAEDFFEDLEIRTLLLWLTLMTCVFAASLCASDGFESVLSVLRRGLFTVIAAFSTTGFMNITSNQLSTVLSSGAFLVIAILMAVGGSAGSTAGGIKLQRIGILNKAIVATVKETLAPDSARVVVSYKHAGRRILSNDVVKSAMTVFILYVVTYMIGALVGIAYGFDAPSAIFESIAMTSNGGMTSGIVAPGMSSGLEIFYIFQMWAGRLEFVTFLAILVEIVISLDPRRLFRGGRR